jgi:hypothetical protein
LDRVLSGSRGKHVPGTFDKRQAAQQADQRHHGEGREQVGPADPGEGLSQLGHVRCDFGKVMKGRKQVGHGVFGHFPNTNKDTSL